MIVPALAAEFWIFTIAGAVVSLAAFTALILVPAVSGFGRTWERVTAAFLSLFVLLALVLVGISIGLVIVRYWDTILGIL